MTDITTIAEVTTPQQELIAAKMLAEAEAELRKIENSRLAVTAPLNASLKTLNQTAKESSYPFTLIKEELQRRLGHYRSQPNVREGLARRERAEIQFRMAERDGNMTRLKEAETVIAELNEVLPRSVPAGEGYVVRYRTKKTYEINESELDDRYFMRVPDEKAISDAMDAGAVLRGVTEKLTVTPFVVETNSPSPEKDDL